MTYRTTSAYVSGAICGAIWWPVGEICGLPVNADIRREFSRCSEPASFRDVLLLILNEKGGDFQGAEFTADSVVRVERIGLDRKGFRSVHVWERAIGDLLDCDDLVRADTFAGDFMGDES